jgi:hypothetical protein
VKIVQIGRRHGAPYLAWSKWTFVPIIGFGILSAAISHGLSALAIATNVALYLTMGMSVAFGQVVFDTVREIRDGRWIVAAMLAFVTIAVGMFVGLVVVGYIFGPTAPFFFTKSPGLIAGS